MSDETRAWIEAAKILGRDPAAHVPCPRCGEAKLAVQDVVVGTTLERHLSCPRCGARNSLLIRLGAEQKARILWFRPEEGGRPSPPPGPYYSAVARFESLSGQWPQEEHGVVLTIRAPVDAEGTMLAGIRTLASGYTPTELWKPGRTFDLYEGPKYVARGDILCLS